MLESTDFELKKLRERSNHSTKIAFIGDTDYKWKASDTIQVRFKGQILLPSAKEWQSCSDKD